jgi:RNA polymerase sigma-70 factor (ECF subfamily)
MDPTHQHDAPDHAGAVIRLLAEHRSTLRAYVRQQVGDHADLDDLEQEVVVAVWRQAGAYDRSRPFPAWMLGFARMHVLRWRGRRNRDRRLQGLDDASGGHLAWAGGGDGERDAALAGCLAELDQESTMLLRWRFREELGLADIADRLRTSVPTASRRLSRLLRTLEVGIRDRLAEAVAGRSLIPAPRHRTARGGGRCRAQRDGVA